MKGGGVEPDFGFSFQKRRFRVAPFTDYAQENPIHRDNFDFYGTMRDLQRRESASGYKAGNFLDAFTCETIRINVRQFNV